jgi:hypothetical protein
MALPVPGRAWAAVEAWASELAGSRREAPAVRGPGLLARVGAPVGRLVAVLAVDPA